MQQENRRILERMRAEQESARRRAVFTSWALVGLAAMVLAALVFVGQRRLEAVNRQVALKRDSVAILNAQIANLEPLVENYRAGLVGDTANLPPDALPADTALTVEPPGVDSTVALVQGVDDRPPHRPRVLAKAREGRPELSQLAPPPERRIPARVYLHILREDDRPHALEVGRRLEASGFSVLGVEHVRRSAPLMNTELRYYKQADEEDGTRLLAALKAAGEESAAMLYLGLERDTRVPPRTYEVWFAPRARPGPVRATEQGQAQAPAPVARDQGRRPRRAP
jgi:hypothetical protein